MPNNASQRAALGIEPNYSNVARTHHNWTVTGTKYIVHITPNVMDDFGNSVRCDLKQIRWGLQQSHDCSSFFPNWRYMHVRARP